MIRGSALGSSFCLFYGLSLVSPDSLRFNFKPMRHQYSFLLSLDRAPFVSPYLKLQCGPRLRRVSSGAALMRLPVWSFFHFWRRLFAFLLPKTSDLHRCSFVGAATYLASYIILRPTQFRSFRTEPFSSVLPI